MSIFGIDRATPLTTSHCKLIKKHEGGKFAKFVLRYLAGSTSWKNMNLEEVNRLKAEGFMIGSIFQEGKDGTKAGYQGGLTAGYKALERAKDIGQPSGSAIFFAVDYDAPVSDYNSIEQFLKGVSVAFASYYKVGIYGKFDVIEEMARRKACSYFWQTLAWSKGKLSKSADLYQYKIDVMANGVNVDLNECFNTDIFWNQIKQDTENKPDTVESGNAENPSYVPSWKFNDLSKLVQQLKISNASLVKAVEALESANEEIPAPKWFITEFPKHSEYLNSTTGTQTFWRSFAVSLRILNKKA